MSPSLSIRLSGLLVAVATLVLAPTLADARGGRGGGGGGMRASGRSSVSRGGGGMSASRSMSSGRNMSASRGASSNRSMSANRSYSTDRGARTAGAGRDFQGGARTGDRTNVAGGDRTRGDRTNIDRGDRTNIRGGNNINTGDINIDGDHGWYDGDGWGGHPIAAGVAFGTAAAVTSAAIGSMYYSLPPSCPPYPYGGYTYYSCGGVYYAPQYSGSSVTYVVVEDPH